MKKIVLPFGKKETAESAVEVTEKKLKPALPIGIVTTVLLFALASLLMLALFAPGVIERRVLRNVEAYVSPASQELTISGSFADQLKGKSQSISLDLSCKENSSVVVSRLVANWSKSNVVLKMLQDEQLLIHDAEPNELVVYWDETDLARWLNLQQPLLTDIKIELTPEQMNMTANITLDGVVHQLAFKALPQASSADTGYLDFNPQEVMLDGAHSSAAALVCASLLNDLPINLAPLEWKPWAQRVMLGESLLTVYCSASCCN